MTVLLVEDSPATQRIQTAAVEAAGRFRALGATNGAEALDLLRKERVDAVVTDLQMPVMDGFQLIAEISTRYPGLPIFVLSANPEPVRRDPNSPRAVSTSIPSHRTTNSSPGRSTPSAPCP